MIKNKRILITGAAGTIGSELVRQLYKNNKIYGLDINETGIADLIRDYNFSGRVGSITDEITVRDVFSDFKPQIIFHAAAYKHVDMMEYVPLEAIKTNVLGTYYLIDYAKKWECVEKFIFISTDKAVNSKSIMGATKRLGEIMVKNQGDGFIVVRFPNILGSRGSVIPIWQRQIDNGRTITITDPSAERYFITIEEAVNRIIKAAETGKGEQTFVFKLKERINVLELAKRIIKESKQDIPLEMIGLRPGEQLVEKLMTEEEEKIAQEVDEFYIFK